MPGNPTDRDNLGFLRAGEAGTLIAAHDWSCTPLGPIESWPQSLRTALGLLLRSPVPMVLLWGDEGVMLYNDGYAVIAGGRHPNLLGSKVREGWPEVADFNDNVMKVGLAGGTLAYRDQEMTLHRNGVAEQVWLDLDYSPVPDESGAPAGVLAIVIETTDRVLAEYRAASSAERTFRMFEQAPGFICTLRGPQHIFEFVNEAYERLFGERHAVGKTARELFPELEGQGFFELLDRVYETGERYVAKAVPIRLRNTPDGPEEHRLLDFIYEPTRNQSGQIDGIFCEGFDVTEAHAAQEELRKSQERLSALNADLERRVIERTQARGRTWQVSPDLMGALNAKGYFETSNPAWQTILGWSEEEVAGMSIFEMLHPDDVDRTKAGFALTQQGQPAIRFPNRYRCKDGTYRWISWVGVPEDGMVYCTGRDITDEKAQEEALAARTAERNRIWEMSRDLFAIMGFDGMLKAINPAWATTLGHDEQTLLSMGFPEQVHPDDHPRVQAMMQDLLRGETVSRFEDRLRHADGTWHWISWTLVPEGDVFFAVGRDVTAEKAAAAELQYAQDALRQSQKMEAMGQLTGGVAHDFNNLLAPIVGSLDMLQRKGLGGAREQRMIEGAMQSAERAKTLVQRLLAFARRQPLQASAVDLGALVTGMADLISSTIGPRIAVSVHLEHDLPAAKADSNQLEMALLNLCVNARDAMPDGGELTIRVDSLELAADNPSRLSPALYARLSVADSGTGMDEATLARAIEPFFSTKGVGRGTGLGLSMVHGLASQLGGALLIDSKPGTGTKVSLLLPTSSRPAAVEQEPSSEAEERHRIGTVLLVDDEELVRMSTADMLSDLGYTVLEASSGEGALRLLERGEYPDIVITDHLMPGMNGTDLARALRSGRPRLPILVISGYAESEGISPDLPRLTKPFRSAELAAALASLQSRASQSA